MRYLHGIIVGCVVCSVAWGRILPEKPAELSSTQLVRVERLKSTEPSDGPDGLSFCFLVSRTATAQHKLAIKQTRDFTVSGRSYRELTQAALGRVFESKVTVYDASKFAADHPELASVLDSAPGKSLVVLLQLSGSPLSAGSEVDVRLHVGFGRTADNPEAEDLWFRTQVPAE